MRNWLPPYATRQENGRLGSLEDSLLFPAHDTNRIVANTIPIRKTPKQRLKEILRSRIASRGLRAHHRRLSTDKQTRLYAALKQHYFSDPFYYREAPDAYLGTPEGEKDMAEHLSNRLEEFRSLVIPWLSSFLSLRGSRILEVGCGTGASSVSLAEQGADVIGIDVSEPALEVARFRLQLHDLRASFVCANATELERVASGQNFEAVIFFAVMEHMTWKERSDSLLQTWQLLRPGQYLVIVESRNRLWHTDSHTSHEPFFLWLPDEIAIPYSRYSERKGYNQAFDGQHINISEDTKVRFARWGRGVSYHDLVLALSFSRPEQLPVVSAMQVYLNRRSPEHFVRNLRSRAYRGFLHKLAPKVHAGFLYEELYIALRKP
jgi:S-adenosylmethionine-dependent methyltransferase